MKLNSSLKLYIKRKKCVLGWVSYLIHQYFWLIYYDSKNVEFIIKKEKTTTQFYLDTPTEQKYAI